MPMSPKDHTTISGLLVVDSAFRDTFLSDPKKAAATLGIQMTDQEDAAVRKQVDQLRKAAAAGVEAIRASTPSGPTPLSGGNKILGGLIPQYLLK